jgi:rare lipoprotein A
LAPAARRGILRLQSFFALSLARPARGRIDIETRDVGASASSSPYPVMDFSHVPTPVSARWRCPAARVALLPLSLGFALLTACTSTRPPVPEAGIGRAIETGMASWYGGKFHGRRTASGEPYDMHEMTAAHRQLPFGTRVEVRNPENGRSVVVRITDRGPFARNRILDVSYAAAQELGMIGPGTAWVELYVAPETPLATHYTVQVAAFAQAELARDLHRALREEYPEAVLRSDGTWHRVQIGAFDSRRKADVLRRELAILGFTPFVVQIP